MASATAGHGCNPVGGADGHMREAAGHIGGGHWSVSELNDSGLNLVGYHHAHDFHDDTGTRWGGRTDLGAGPEGQGAVVVKALRVHGTHAGARNNAGEWSSAHILPCACPY